MDPFEGTGCIILDVNMEGKTGMELQEELIKKDSHLPIIFITGYGNIPMSVDALKKGASNFLEKPFKVEELFQSISESLVLSRRLKKEKEEVQKARRLIGSLTPRENEILTYLISGLLNKQIAFKLNIAEQTVKIHKHRICEKLGVNSLMEILHIAEKAGIHPSL
jgi:FixJ family two-component response regulator